MFALISGGVDGKHGTGWVAAATRVALAFCNGHAGGMAGANNTAVGAIRIGCICASGHTTQMTLCFATSSGLDFRGSDFGGTGARGQGKTAAVVGSRGGVAPGN